MITGVGNLRQIAKFCAKVLEIKPTLHITFSDDENHSECVVYESGDFELRIQDWLVGRDLVKAIAHEMVHVWQHMRGDLVTDYDKESWIWKGTEYKNPKTVENYFLLPWELEARALEDWLEWRWRHK